jgi:NADH-quinone oxidoreductase subunit I
MFSVIRTIWLVFLHMFRKRVTIQYPEARRHLPARTRGRIVLTRDPAGRERCVACYLCSAVCPVGCIALQAAEDADGRRRPGYFRINFSRCIFCGFCEEACPTAAIQLTPDYEMAEYHRDALVYEKDDLTIAGTGKCHSYDFYAHAGLAIAGKDKGLGLDEQPPVDTRTLLP